MKEDRMPYGIDTKRLTPRRARLLTAVALLSVALAVAGCGGSSSPGVAHLSSKKGASSANSESSGSASESPATLQQAMIAFAKCMRASGVPNFPDPNAGGGFRFHAHAGVVNSPLFKAAQAKCHKLLPEGPGSGPPPSAQTLARFLRIAQCMRHHGVYDFPDPRTSVPPNPLTSGYGVISDIEGVILLFPRTIDQQSPVFTRASATCAFPLHNH
jgi:hypothetical protein